MNTMQRLVEVWRERAEQIRPPKSEHMPQKERTRRTIEWVTYLQLAAELEVAMHAERVHPPDVSAMSDELRIHLA